MGLLTRMFNPGSGSSRKQKLALRDARFTGGSFNGAGGLGAGFSFDSNNQANLTSSLGEFAPWLQQLFGQASGAFDRVGQGIEGLKGRFEPMMEGLNKIFSQSSQQAQQDPMQAGQVVTDILRQRAAGGAQGMIRDTFDRLFQSGGLSNQVTREQTLDAEQRRLSDEDLGFQLAGIDQGRNMVNDAFNRTMASSQGVGGIEQLLESISQNRISSGLQQGMGLIQGAQGLAMMPNQLMAALAGIQGQRSDTQLGIAQGFGQNAANAESTFGNMSKWFNNMFPAGPTPTTNTF
jgi:hypothetical protein